MAPLSVPFYHEAGATSSLLQYAKLLRSAWRSPSSERLTLPAPRPSAFPRWRVRANLKERDENVRFKQSMTSHVSREGQTRKLEANGNASRLNPMVGFVCGFGSCGDLLIEHPQTARAPGRLVVRVCPVIAGKRSAQSWPLRSIQRAGQRRRESAQSI